MKKWIIRSFAFIFISHSFVNVGIGLHFYFNKTYIIQAFCENKNVPGKNCNGHCFYTKQLKKAEQNERHKDAKWMKEKAEIVSQREWVVSIVINTTTTVFCLRPFYSKLALSDHTTSLVKPPAV